MQKIEYVASLLEKSRIRARFCFGAEVRDNEKLRCAMEAT